jgi:transposase
MIRNAKFWGLEYSPEFIEMLSLTNSLLNDISQCVREEISNGSIVNINSVGLGQYVELNDGEEVTQAGYRDRIRYILDKYPVVEKKKGIERQLVGYVLERFAGYFKRNKDWKETIQKKIPRITFKNKSLYNKDRNVEINKEKKEILFHTVFGDYKIPYSLSIKSDHLDSGNFGGNLIVKQKCFVVAVDVPFVQQYTPEKVLGFDINKSLNNWIVFNSGDVIPAPDVVADYIEKIRKLNKTIDNGKKEGLKSSQRRCLRKQIINKHGQLHAEIKKVCEKIVEVVKNQKALLCIDMVKTGQNMGTFGQDKIIPELQTLCENQGIPFIAVPCKNTSRRCSSCGYVHKDNRKTTDEFECLKCGHDELSHLNAAKNISFLGNKMFEAGVPCGNHGRISVEKLIEKHGSHQHPKQHVMAFMSGS